MRADARAWVINCTAGTFRGLAAAGGSRGNGGVGFLIAVGAGNNGLELASVVAEIGRCSGLDPGSPERALVVCDAGWQGAVIGGVQSRVSLDVDVEAGAEGGVVAPLGTAQDIVAVQGDEAEVGVCVDAGVEVLEGLGIAGWGLCRESVF